MLCIFSGLFLNIYEWLDLYYQPMAVKNKRMQASMRHALSWFEKNQWTPFPFQLTTWERYLGGHSGLLNAPTGSGKTYAVWLACLLEFLNGNRKHNGLQVLWITPLRALSNDISLALQKSCR